VESTMLDKMGSALTSLRDLSRWCVQATISVPTALFFELLTYGTMTSLSVAELARHILLSAGYGLLPVFIAGFNSDLFKRSAYRYAMRMVSLHLWPVAWSLIGAITLVVAHLLRSYVDSLFATAAIDPAGEFGFVELIAVTPTVVVLAMALTMIVMTTWQIYGLIKVPALLAKLLTAGGEAFEGVIDRLASGSTQTITVTNLSSPLLNVGSNGGSVTSTGLASSARSSIGSGGGHSARMSRNVGELNEVFGVARQKALEMAKGNGGR